MASFLDDFQRADENLEASANWVHDGLIVGGLSIVSNKLQCNTSSTSGTAYIAATQMDSKNHSVQITIEDEAGQLASGGPTVCCRLADVDNWVGFRVEGFDQLAVVKRVAGTATIIETLNITFGTGSVIKLEVFQDSYFLTVDGKLKEGGSLGGDLATGNGVGLVARNSTFIPWITAFEAHDVLSTVGGFEDDFNRANENLEASFNWIHDGAITGAAAVSSNQLACTTTDLLGSAYYAGENVGGEKHWVEFTVENAMTAETGPVVCCMLTDNANWVGVRAGNNTVNNGVIEILKCVAGVRTILYTSAADTCVTGDTIKLEMFGPGETTLYLNGVMTAGPDVPGPRPPASNKTGVVMRASALNPWIDNFRTGPLLSFKTGSFDLTFDVTGDSLGKVYMVGDTTLTFTNTANLLGLVNLTGSFDNTYTFNGVWTAEVNISGNTTLDFDFEAVGTRYRFGEGTFTNTYTFTSDGTNFVFGAGSFINDYAFDGRMTFCNDWPYGLTSGSTPLDVQQTSGSTTKFCYT